MLKNGDMISPLNEGYSDTPRLSSSWTNICRGQIRLTRVDDFLLTIFMELYMIKETLELSFYFCIIKIIINSSFNTLN